MTWMAEMIANPITIQNEMMPKIPIRSQTCRTVLCGRYVMKVSMSLMLTLGTNWGIGWPNPVPNGIASRMAMPRSTFSTVRYWLDAWSRAVGANWESTDRA